MVRTGQIRGDIPDNRVGGEAPHPKIKTRDLDFMISRLQDTGLISNVFVNSDSSEATRSDSPSTM